MTNLTTIAVASLALFVQSPPKVPASPDSFMATLKLPSKLSEAEETARSTRTIWIDAKAFRDMESVVLALPETETFSKDALRKLIQSHRIQAEKSIASIDKIEDAMKKNLMTILDGNKAIKEAETLRKELDKLRKKKSPGGGLGGASN